MTSDGRYRWARRAAGTAPRQFQRGRAGDNVLACHRTSDRGVR